MKYGMKRDVIQEGLINKFIFSRSEGILYFCTFIYGFCAFLQVGTE